MLYIHKNYYEFLNYMHKLIFNLLLMVQLFNLIQILHIKYY